MTIFHYDALPVNANFGAGILAPPAASAKLNPGRPARVEGPTDEERVQWAFRDEIAAFNRLIEADAAEYEFLTSLNNGRFHA